MPFKQARLKILSINPAPKKTRKRSGESRNKRRLKRRQIARAVQHLSKALPELTQTTLNFKVVKGLDITATSTDHLSELDSAPTTLKEDCQRRESTPIKVEELDSSPSFDLFSQSSPVLPDFILSKEDFLRPHYGIHTCHNFPARAVSEPTEYQLPVTPTKRFRRTNIQIEEDNLHKSLNNEKKQMMLEENIQAHNTGKELPFKIIGLSTPKKQPLRLKKRTTITMSPAIITEEMDAWSEL